MCQAASFVTSVLLIVLAVSLGLPTCFGQVQPAIDEMMAGARGKVAMEPLIEKVSSFGSLAVPFLTGQYHDVNPNSRWALAAALCAIGTPEARTFVRGLLKESDKNVTVRVIGRYPIDYEDEILDLLVGLLFGDRGIGYDAKQRLIRMIVRKPTRAGYLIECLKDSPEAESDNQRLFEVLEWTSGYSFTWGTDIPIGVDPVKYRNDFWRNWWKNSKDKEVFEWLIDTYNSNPNLAQRQAEAIQILGGSPIAGRSTAS